ncbi:MAG TPA: UDP-N-acetylmuramoyl-L-alanyl-D-glutamate--2,6-diaminopimelate ligase [Chloroflexota bacterium]
MPALLKLLEELPYARVEGDAAIEITGIAYDSRLVRPGDLFVALPGFHVDGTSFVADALRRGAVAVVSARPGVATPGSVPRIAVPDARRALTDLAAAYYGHPARELRVVGVTGTDGKTTTTHLVSAVLEAMGFQTGFITTADVKVGASLEYNETQHTTPEPVEVQALLRRMVDEGVDYAVLESSSHALALDRLLHCEFDAAIFTNLSPEHLNFHGSMEAYLRDKSRLFSMLDTAVFKGREKVAILNADDPHSEQMAAATHTRVVWYGMEDGETQHSGLSTQDPSQSSVISHQSSVRATEVELLPSGSRFLLETPVGSVRVQSRLSGRFNVYNWLAAAALGLSQGASLDQISRAVASVDAVPGRMQRIDAGQPFAVVVDFAHTPQALEKALTALRQATRGRLVVLFGLAGERDPGNRSEMGRIAARLADFALFTTDDPRFEDPMAIAEQVAEGAREMGWREGERYLKIADREEAIRRAFERARAGDTVLLAGKGHERRQVMGDRLVPWSDEEAARRLLAELGYS